MYVEKVRQYLKLKPYHPFPSKFGLRYNWHLIQIKKCGHRSFLFAYIFNNQCFIHRRVQIHVSAIFICRLNHSCIISSTASTESANMDDIIIFLGLFGSGPFRAASFALIICCLSCFCWVLFAFVDLFSLILIYLLFEEAFYVFTIP
jgi:hypothetical protein